MNERHFVRLVGKAQRDFAKRCIDDAPPGWIVQIAAPTRSLDQNARLHAMLGDVQQQVDEMRTYNMKDMKLRFMDALGTELRFLPKLEGEGMFPVGLKSSDLTKAQFSLLLEVVRKYGDERNVRWSEPNPYEEAA